MPRFPHQRPCAAFAARTWGMHCETIMPVKRTHRHLSRKRRGLFQYPVARAGSSSPSASESRVGCRRATTMPRIAP